MENKTNIRNIYFCWREIETTLDYSIIVNVPEQDKKTLYEKEKLGYKITKILANE